MQSERLEWAADPVMYVLRHEFPGYGRLSPLEKGGPTLGRPFLPAEAEARRKALKALSDEDQFSLAARARVKELEDARAKAEGREGVLLLNLLGANARGGWWAKMPCWSLEEGVLLSLGTDPRVARWVDLSSLDGMHGSSRLFVDTYEMARRAVSMRELGETNAPNVFIAWAKHHKLPFPKELQAEVAQFGSIDDWRDAYQQEHADLEAARARIADLEHELADVKDSAAHRWPWGTYETELLRKLHAAVQRYWVKYDAADPSTANNSDDVVAWLRTQNVNGKPIAQRVAEIIAQIIRADGLRTGPR